MDLKDKVRKRQPWDEIDPETGEPVENIPGVEYPPEFAAAEDIGIAAATGGTGFGPKAILRAAGKKAVGKAEASAVEAVNRRLTELPAHEAAAIRKDPARMQQMMKEHMAPEVSPRPEYKPNISEGSPINYGVKDVPAADRTAPRRIQELQKIAKIPEDQVVGQTPSGTPIVKEPPKKAQFPEYQGQTHQEKMAQQRKEGASGFMDWLKKSSEE